MEQRLTIVALGVRNLEESRAFYGVAFGWSETKSSNENIAFFQLNGILLSLYPRDKLAEDAAVDPAGSGFKGYTLAYNCRSKVEVDKTIDYLRLHGADVVKEPQEVFWGGYSSYIADPDGHLWEIAFNPYLKLDDQGNIIPE